MSIWRFADLFDSPPPSARISLGEGNTPLIRSRSIGPAAGLPHLYFKLESGNPSGSYKDRFAAAAISGMLAESRRVCIATSSGNTGSALAAYCAVAGIQCRIAIVESAPQGKLRQMMAYGADISRIRGFGTHPDVTRQTFAALQSLGSHPGYALQISGFAFSPVGMSGVQSISYELAEQLDSVEHVFAPAGGGGLTLAVARGFRIVAEAGQIRHGPAIHCVQPEGNNTIAGPLAQGKDHAQEVDCTTQISGLQVAIVVDGNEVIAACRESGGTGQTVPDTTVWMLQKRLAREEGIFCEPAGAVALAGALQAAADRTIDSGAAIVCLVTGSGFKDETSLDRLLSDATCELLTLESFMDRF